MLIVVIITLSMMRKPLKVAGIDMLSSRAIELCSALHHNRPLEDPIYFLCFIHINYPSDLASHHSYRCTMTIMVTEYDAP
jgi:hypothetical protein